MAYAGYLIKLGGSSGTVLPMEYISIGSYNSTPNQRMESQAVRAVTGLLHRTTVAHKASKIEFTTPVLTNKQVATLNALFAANFSDNLARKIKIYYYDQETDSYRNAECYMPDVTYTIDHINPDTNIVYYTGIRYAFIEY